MVANGTGGSAFAHLLKDFDPATGVCRHALPGSLVTAEASVARHMSGISPESGDVVIGVCRLGTPAAPSTGRLSSR